MSKTIAIIAALDTKGDEAGFVRDLIASRGVVPLLIDVGVLGDPTTPANVTRAAVAVAGGADLKELVSSRDKTRSMQVMTRGAATLVRQLYRDGSLHGVLGLGGSAGTTISAAAMRELPVGVPTLIVSTIPSSRTDRFVGDKDLTLMYSVVDIAGLNRVSKRVLTNAAAAIVGMVEAEAPQVADRPLIAASMFGNTTPLVDRARRVFESAGYEVLVFHATGTGGRTMESLIDDGLVDGVFDVTTTEWADELCGGVAGSGPDRLGAAARAGIPQVVAPGCLDMINFHRFEDLPEKFRSRVVYRWNESATLVRTTPDECARLGQIIAEKVSASRGLVSVLLPLRGVSQLDAPGGPFWWPEANRALFDSIKANVREDIPVVELDNNVNDPEFADRAADILLEYLATRRK